MHSTFRSYLRHSEHIFPTSLRRLKRSFFPIDTLFGREFLADLIPQGGVGVEIGVFRGDFSRWFLDHVHPKKLTLVDPWFPVEEYADSDHVYQAKLTRMDRRYSNVCARFRAERDTGQVRILRLKSIEAAPLIEDNSLDWMYVDGDHRESAVRADIRAYWQKLRRGGLMIFDDYGYSQGWDDGVTKACDALLDQPLARQIATEANQLVVKKIGVGVPHI